MTSIHASMSRIESPLSARPVDPTTAMDMPTAATGHQRRTRSFSSRRPPGLIAHRFRFDRAIHHPLITTAESPATATTTTASTNQSVTLPKCWIGPLPLSAHAERCATAAVTHPSAAMQNTTSDTMATPADSTGDSYGSGKVVGRGCDDGLASLAR